MYIYVYMHIYMLMYGIGPTYKCMCLHVKTCIYVSKCVYMCTRPPTSIIMRKSIIIKV